MGRNVKKNNQLGAGMIEVLVSLLVLAIGLLGVMSLQANGLSSNQRAVFSTEAQILAQDIADRILAYGNLQNGANIGANRGEYAPGNNYDTGNTKADGFTPPSPPDCATQAFCSLADTAGLDLSDWITSLSGSSLPGARGQIDWVNNNTYRIIVMWDQDRTGASDVNCRSNDKETFLTCFEMRITL